MDRNSRRGAVGALVAALLLSGQAAAEEAAPVPGEPPPPESVPEGAPGPVVEPGDATAEPTPEPAPPVDESAAAAPVASEPSGGEEPAPAEPPAAEPAAEPAAPATPWPMTLPRLEVATADGNTSLRLRFVAQLQLDYTMTDQGEDGLEHDASVFFRRLRPDLTGTVLTRDLTYRLYLNIVPGALELMEYWVSYRFHDQAQLLVGTAKVPFTRYRLNSFPDLPFVDWSNPTRYFGAERQLGLMLHNGVTRPGWLEYQVGLYTGSNTRGSNGIGMSRVCGERAPNRSDLVDPAPLEGFHPEIVAHVGYSTGEMNVRDTADFDGGPARFMIGLSGAWDFDPVEAEDMTYRLAPEVLFKAYGFFAQGIFYLGGFDEVAGDRVALPGFVGTLVQAGYFFGGRFQVALRYSLLYLLPELRADARSRADARIAAAEDEDEAEALRAQYSSVGRLVAEHDLGVAFDVFLVGTALVLKLDGSMLLHARTDEDRVDGRVRAMLQVSF